MSNFESQSFIDHLVDLRTMLIRSLWIIMIGFAVTLIFREELFAIIRAPIAPYLPNNGLVFTAPSDKFVAYIKVCFLGSVFITCPLWLYQVWLFIAPGLYKHEKRLALYFIFFGSLLFMSGTVFVYKLIFPMAFKYLLTFGGTVDTPMITINEYLEFFMMTTLVFGIAFEMPLILVVLGMMGVIDEKMLKSQRRLAVMGLAVLSAVVTPPDAMSMLSLLLPLLFLYEISIILVKITKPKPREPIA